MKKLLITSLLILCVASNLYGCTKKDVKPLTPEDISSYTSQMSTNPLSGDITINGVKYSLPVSVQAFLDNQWKFNNYDSQNGDLENGYYSDSVTLDDGHKDASTRISSTIFNTSGSTVKFKDAMVGAIHISKTDNYKNTVVLPNSITLDSTYDDVINAYGTPKVDYFANNGTVYYYETDIGKYGQKLTIKFDTNTKIIKEITLQNIPRN